MENKQIRPSARYLDLPGADMEEFIKCMHDDRPTYPGICIKCGARYVYCTDCRAEESICQDCQIKDLEGRFRILDGQPPLDDETIQLLDREWEEGQARAE